MFKQNRRRKIILALVECAHTFWGWAPCAWWTCPPCCCSSWTCCWSPGSGLDPAPASRPPPSDRQRFKPSGTFQYHRKHFWITGPFRTNGNLSEVPGNFSNHRKSLHNQGHFWITGNLSEPPRKIFYSRNFQNYRKPWCITGYFLICQEPF